MDRRSGAHPSGRTFFIYRTREKEPMSEEKPPARGRRGEMERKTRALIRAMCLEGTPEQSMLVSQAIAGARTMDEALAPGGKRYMLTAGHRLQREALAALRACDVSGAPAVQPDEGASDVLLWVAAIHRPSIECQGAYPVVTPGECEACDAAVVARAQYGKRHPDEPGHEYGMSREQCGCEQCRLGA